MRDDQMRRYSRHILLPDVGGIGQAALLAATVRVDLDSPPADATAALVAARYLVAGGVGVVAVPGATAAQLAELAAHNPDTQVLVEAPAGATALPVPLPSPPPWWPAADGDATALALWRGGLAAARLMAEIANR